MKSKKNIELKKDDSSSKKENSQEHNTKKKRKPFEIEKCFYTYNTETISRWLDPITARIAKVMYNIGFTPNVTTMCSFIFGLTSIAVLYFLYPTIGYTALVIAAILITIRNIGDTVDGKIARGADMKSDLGGFSDIVSDWIFFHAGFFAVIGIITGHPVIGFLCVTGYMSREFTRRKFEKAYGMKAKETEESAKVSGIVSFVRLYDLASVFWLIPIFLLINQPAWIIYIVAVIEYGLLFAELSFDYYCLLKKSKKEKLEKSN